MFIVLSGYIQQRVENKGVQLYCRVGDYDYRLLQTIVAFVICNHRALG